MDKKLFSALLIFIATLIWGFGFVVSSLGIRTIGPFLFIGSRMTVASLVLIPVYRISKRFSPALSPEEEKESFRIAVKAGFFMGLLMVISNGMSLIALAHMTAGKNAFLGSLYVAVVPFIMLLLGEKSPVRVWFGVGLAVVGLFFLSVKGDSMAISPYDLLVAGTAVFSALVNIVTGQVANRVNPTLLVLMEAISMSVLGWIVALITEPISADALIATMPEILYMAVLGTCVAFTLQATGQKHVDATVTSILTSLTSVLAMVFGLLFLGQHMTGREMFGGALVFAATIISNLPSKKTAETKTAEE